MERLQKNIDYSFNNIDLLKQALTHRSVGKQNNERLEFLGDSVLGSIISRELYQRFPSIDEGQLSRLRSHMVRGQTLAKLAKEIKLSEQLIL
jgi:ribonuclease-3